MSATNFFPNSGVHAPGVVLRKIELVQDILDMSIVVYIVLKQMKDQKTTTLYFCVSSDGMVKTSHVYVLENFELMETVVQPKETNMDCIKALESLLENNDNGQIKLSDKPLILWQVNSFDADGYQLSETPALMPHASQKWLICQLSLVFTGLALRLDYIGSPVISTDSLLMDAIEKNDPNKKMIHLPTQEKKGEFYLSLTMPSSS